MSFVSFDHFTKGERIIDELSKFDKIDYGVTVGIEKILNNGMILGLNYSQGLANMIDDMGYGHEVKNRQLTFGVKYEFYRLLH